ncbi:nickel-dependent hydrogenase large subunit [Streptomyces sp. G45]|uniref:nickel-dependent hydrogenase large subunit n=1 Tax=Streptomyces sp. G45 TaxID=3406627 RepID=UPI003C23105A
MATHLRAAARRRAPDGTEPGTLTHAVTTRAGELVHIRADMREPAGARTPGDDIARRGLSDAVAADALTRLTGAAVGRRRGAAVRPGRLAPGSRAPDDRGGHRTGRPRPQGPAPDGGTGPRGPRTGIHRPRTNAERLLSGDAVGHDAAADVRERPGARRRRRPVDRQGPRTPDAVGPQTEPRPLAERLRRAPHSRLDARRHLTGSLARYAISGRWLSRTAVEAAREAGLGDPYQGAVCRNPYRSILVRAVEVVYAVGEALRIIDTYEQLTPPFVDVPPTTSTGHGATEAPRGLLYHRYALDADGTITEALLVPPTAQNQGAIEDDLRRTATRAIARAGLSDAELTDLCERAIRNHDPCISCSTHFLDLTVVRTSGGDHA